MIHHYTWSSMLFFLLSPWWNVSSLHLPHVICTWTSAVKLRLINMFSGKETKEDGLKPCTSGLFVRPWGIQGKWAISEGVQARLGGVNTMCYHCAVWPKVPMWLNSKKKVLSLVFCSFLLPSSQLKCSPLSSSSDVSCAACSLGQVSSMSVATGTYIRIPNTAKSSEGQDCFLGCRCDSKGELEHCRPLPCLQRRHCMLGAGNKQGG